MQLTDSANHSYDYRPNWTPLSPITIINNINSGKRTKLFCILLKSSVLVTASGKSHN